MNILICSAGRRVKLVKYFLEELSEINGNIVLTDCDMTAPTLQFVKNAEVVPQVSHPKYIEHIRELCNKHEISAILSLIDPELGVLVEHKEEFDKENIKIIISNKEVVNICFDKYLTYKFLKEHGLPGIPTYIDINEILSAIESSQLSFPLIIKPRRGSASTGISTINSIQELHATWKENEELIAQPFMVEEEYGVDCYVDLLSNKVTNIFCKRKIKMRAGETDKSVAIADNDLFELIEKLINYLKPIGPIDIDCFKTKKGFVISEINPRFGGGYPHAHEMGQNYVKNIINNLKGLENKPSIGNYSPGSTMIKYDEIMILK
ncbi:ATP-grasp domain-containing protein [Peribacillus sp. NPDC097198]|uniref:ATP-grasp domain-containing protein n=1 Tax=Peribacillus sp. NPDC097198 TaxID=3364397 RepID=UPI003823C10B